MVSWLTVTVLLMVCAVFGAFCVAVARAFFQACSDRTSYCMVGMWAACLAAIVVGCLVMRDARGTEVAAMFAVGVCAVSFPLYLTLERHWRNRDMAAAVAYLQLHRSMPEPASALEAPRSPWGASLEATCARLARAYNLTRREENVLCLLMEGCTFVQAADELVVSLNTVKSHVRHIYAKMGVSSKQNLLEKVSHAE